MIACRLLAFLLLPGLCAAAAPARRVLFLGNSLTYANDLPALVGAMAKCGGFDLDCTARAKPDFALEDHWSDGARGTLRRGKFDVVVMQQGPSTQPDSRAHLRVWAGKWAGFARENGAEPVLYMVWPFATQKGGFLLVSESYREAARSCGARIFPAGEAWALAYHADPSLRLYEPDALHPTGAGSYLAALVIARGLTGLDPARVPARLKLADGSTLTVDERQAALFRGIVRQLRYDEDPAQSPAPVLPAAR
jgi:hypothetical protein